MKILQIFYNKHFECIVQISVQLTPLTVLFLFRLRKEIKKQKREINKQNSTRIPFYPCPSHHPSSTTLNKMTLNEIAFLFFFIRIDECISTLDGGMVWLGM